LKSKSLTPTPSPKGEGSRINQEFKGFIRIQKMKNEK
jgi:hypothetical protein